MNASKRAVPELNYLSIINSQKVHYQQSVAELVECPVVNGEGSLSESGALAADTGHFTGRTRYDRFIVAHAQPEDTVVWGDGNQPPPTASSEHPFTAVGT